MKKRPPSICLSLLTALALSTLPSAYGDEKPSFSLFVDQDVFWPPALDQDFTMGVLLSWTGGSLDQSRSGRLLRFLDQAVPSGHLGFSSTDRIRVSVGDSAFTPAKKRLTLSGPVPWDRPYANLLFASVRRDATGFAMEGKGAEVVNVPSRHATMGELTVGVLGLRIGEVAQKWIHRHVSRDVTPGGWSHQISAGGEPTARYRRVWKYLLIDRPAGGGARQIEAPRRFDMQGAAEASLGYYTYVGLGVTARWSPWPRAGLIESPWWGVDRSPNDNVRAPNAGAEPPRHSPRDRELYLVAGLTGTYWGYNALMQGQCRDSEVTLPFGPPSIGKAGLKRPVGEASFGITGRLKNFSLSYMVTKQTPLFDGYDPDGVRTRRGHNWGGVYLSWRR